MGQIIELQLKKKEYEDFLRIVFKSTNKTDPIKLVRTEDVGRYIDSMVEISQFPIKEQKIIYNHSVMIELPTSHSKIEENGFLFIPDWKLRKTNDYIGSCYGLTFREWMNLGRDLNMQMKRVYEFFLSAHKTHPDMQNLEKIKKRDVRNRKKTQEMLFADAYEYVIQ